MTVIAVAFLTVLLLFVVGFTTIKTMIEALETESQPQVDETVHRSPLEQSRFLAAEAKKLAVLTGDYSYP